MLLAALVGVFSGLSAQALTVEIGGADRPQVGQALTAKADAEGCAFSWRRGATDKAGGCVLAEAPLASTAAYAPTAEDLEHWLEVTATKGGESATARIWFSKLPVAYVDVTDGNALDRESGLNRAYRSATMRIQGNAEFAEQYNGAIQIKGRGNTSWLQYRQKPYRIKLDAKTDLFGFGRNKHWILLSCYADTAMLRNRLGSELAKALGVVGMDMTWTACILNGRYNGVYMLCESIRIAKNRVDISDLEDCGEDMAAKLFEKVAAANRFGKSDRKALERQMAKNLSWITSGRVAYGGREFDLRALGLMKDGLDVSGGFLLELDGHRKPGEECLVTRRGVKCYACRPESALVDPTLKGSIADLMARFEDAYRSVDGYNDATPPQHFSEICDLDSMAGFLLAHETMGNMDADTYSRYVYKDCGKKLTFGPVWDLDIGAFSAFQYWKFPGRSLYRGYQLPENWAAAARVGAESLFTHWLDDPVFSLRAVQLYRDVVRPWLDALLAPGGKLDVYHAYLVEAGRTYDTRFPSLLGVDIVDAKRRAGGFANDFENVREFLTRRRAWFDVQFGYGADSLDKGIETLMTSVAAPKNPNRYRKDDGSRLALAAAADGKSVSVTVKNSKVAKVRCYANGLRLKELTGSATLDVTPEMRQGAIGGVVLVAADGYDANGALLARNYVTVKAEP